MWWKLLLLGLVSAVLVIAIQPIRTHAAKIDLSPQGGLPAQRQGLLDVFSAMYVTPMSLVISGVILALAGYLAFRIIRG
jgi:hypothetical protein